MSVAVHISPQSLAISSYLLKLMLDYKSAVLFLRVLMSFARFPSALMCQQVGGGGELSAACWPAPEIRLGGLGRQFPPWLPRLVLVLTRLGWESPSWLGGTRQAPPPRAGARAGSELALAC